MQKYNTPFFHALGAAIYIVLIVFVMNTFVGGPDPETVLLPMMMLSLFVLSAAVMGFLFVYEPLCLYIDGHKKEALGFFAKTIAFFACFVAACTVLVSLAM